MRESTGGVREREEDKGEKDGRIVGALQEQGHRGLRTNTQIFKDKADIATPSSYLFSVHGFQIEFESLKVDDECGWQLSERTAAQRFNLPPCIRASGETSRESYCRCPLKEGVK
jgi:hypothetical protein